MEVTPASIFYAQARVVELVDTRDLKSLGGNSVPVRVRPRAPFAAGRLESIVPYIIAL